MGSGDGQQSEPLQGAEEPGGDGQLGRLPAVSRQAEREGRGRAGKFRCPPRPSGNMPAGRGARRAIASGTRSRSWANMRGMARTRTARRTRWARRSRTPGGSTTCTGTYGSGARIGMMSVTMRTRRRTIRRGLPRARTACFAAVAGTARRGSAGRRTATDGGPGDRSDDLGFRVSLAPADK